MQDNKIQQVLIQWFNTHKRNLPWRQDRTWYKVWISEIMLQQTQVDQVKDYFYKFINKFPTIDRLANSDLQSLLKVWEGMGYYSRARNIHKTAQIIVNKYNGKFPTEKSAMLKLPGIGEYTANAILSFAFNKPFSVVDGNVIRVISRLLGITEDIRKSEPLKIIKDKSDKLLPKNDSVNYNESVMELGALICSPKNPKCEECPLNGYCKAFKNNLTDKIPFKSKTAKKPTHAVLVQILKNANNYFIVKRKEDGLLGGYWEFPFKQIAGKKELENSKNKSTFKNIKHSYTHFNLLMCPVFIEENELYLNNKIYCENRWLSLQDIQKLPIHKAMQKVLKAIAVS